MGQSQNRDFSTENFNEKEEEKDMLLAEQEYPSFCEVVTAIKVELARGDFFF